ncbi:MAG TPA: hypothetical protein VLZ89_15840 [Anaerolineales bacterium]|nr:hypothetical protein [Anaerolineales bacterium]
MKRIFAALLLLVMFAFPSAALADVAPPANPPGSNLQPGTETTQVRMMAESVLIDVKNDTSANSLGSAAVTADFTMRNLGSNDESMAARFPISADNGFGQYPEITNLAITVNGKKISYRRASYPDVRSQGQNVPWAEFEVAFPSGQDVGIEVVYNLAGSGYPDLPYSSYYYILETGAGWQGTIGSADITLRLPYPADPENIALDQIGWAQTTPGGTIGGKEMHWHFENFEPGPNGVVDNMEFALVAPYAWQTILKDRGMVASMPDDGEAWGQLAKAYKAIFFLNKAYRTDAGGAEIYQSSLAAYEKCLTFLPNDAEWHAGFAELLASRSYWDRSASGPTAETYRAFQEIQTALQLSPDDAKVQDIAQEISNMFPEAVSPTGSSYDFVWLTQTPTPLPAVPTTATPEPQETLAPPTGLPSTPNPPSPSKSPWPFCGTAVLAPLAIALRARRGRRPDGQK